MSMKMNNEDKVAGSFGGFVGLMLKVWEWITESFAWGEIGTAVVQTILCTIAAVAIKRIIDNYWPKPDRSEPTEVKGSKNKDQL